MLKVIHEETLCCGSKRCPEVKIFDDGSITLSDNDNEIGSVGKIVLRSEMVDQLALLIARNKK